MDLKCGKTYFILSGLAVTAFFLSLFLSSLPAQSADSGTIAVTVSVGVCGDNVVQYGEDCDGSALDGQTCESLGLGYDTGTLSCDISCVFDESECVDLGPDEGSAVFSGTAYPSSVVKILKDGLIAATIAADANGYFETTLSNLIVGSYTFAVYAYDSNDNKSKTLTYTRDIAKDEIEQISDIIIPPTLVADESEVKVGDDITFSGQAAPSAPVAILLSHGSSSQTLNTTSGSNGFYSYRLDTQGHDKDDYTASATVKAGALTSESSEEIDFGINEKASANNSAKGWHKVDFNDDSRVNLIDFSILIHWLGKSGFPSKVDVNTDKKVNLSDFSIMMYYWTG